VSSKWKNHIIIASSKYNILLQGYTCRASDGLIYPNLAFLGRVKTSVPGISDGLKSLQNIVTNPDSIAMRLAPQ
jgi:hypothetical protein